MNSTVVDVLLWAHYVICSTCEKEDKLDDIQTQAREKTSPGAWKIWLKTARPFSLTAAVSPVLVGTAVAAYDGAFHPVSLLAALLSGLFFQMGDHFFNVDF